MEGYGAGSQSDPGGEGFAEETRWQMGQEMFPERPGEPNCKYYLRTGGCRYGSKCRFNHPSDRSTVVGVMRIGGGGEYPQRVGQPVCKYYMMTGTCKFGSSCKYHHPRQGGGSHVPLNYLNYPLRPGEKECAYYVKTGQCKFGITCKFHHPQPANMPVSIAAPPQGISLALPALGIYSPQMQPPSISATMPNWQVGRPPTMFPYPFGQGPYTHMLLPPGMVPMPGGWGHFPAHLSPASTTQSTLGPNPPYGISQLSSSAAEYTGPYSSVSLSVGPSSSGSSHKEQGLPERPGQPDCQYYMKTGECKYGSSCKYHHPPELSRPKISSESANLPIPPGALPYIFYDHTSRAGNLSYSPSASSLSDIPVAPLPVGSSTGTLAASSSSSDLHQELAAVSIKDSSPAPVLSSSSALPTIATSLTSTQHSTASGSKEAQSSS